MSIDNAMSVAVRDLKSAEPWYEHVLGQPADSKAMPEVAEWKFGRGGWLQVYQQPERAGGGSFTLAVTGIDELAARLQKLDIDTRQRRAGEKVNTLMIIDPDGNHIAFAEALDSTMAR